MNARAINDYVILQESKLGTKKTSGGFELVEALDNESRYRKGTIIDPGQFDVFKKGDEVLYDKKAGNGSPDLGDRWKVVRIRDIAVIL